MRVESFNPTWLNLNLASASIMNEQVGDGKKSKFYKE
jgi:hypothetical protein